MLKGLKQSKIGFIYIVHGANILLQINSDTHILEFVIFSAQPKLKSSFTN